MEHPTLETMAKWLAGRLEHEAVLREIVPHLQDHCPVCREQYEQIRRLTREAGHSDEEVGVVEWREAPELLGRLEELPFPEQIRQIEEDEALHTWGLCQLLLQRSREVVSENPRKALERAELAVAVSHHLGAAYDLGWVLDLRARAYAHLGNARRVVGELLSAEASFRKAESLLAQSRTGNLWAEAEVLDMKGSLRMDQRRFEEARKLFDRARELYREEGDSHGTAKVFLKQAKLFREMEDLEQAIAWLQRSPEEIDSVQEPHLFAAAMHNLLATLALAGRFGEALELLPEVRSLLRETARPLDWVRLRWTEGSIAFGLGRLDEAEAAYREVHREFLKHGVLYSVALVSLDLALLLSGQGRTDELKRLAAELMEIFAAQEVHREATAALVLFQRACEEERVTAELISRLSVLLRRKG
ncbi:MAG TPA: tetratricopeptide repeat protein [Thermoanaerobaculia bacterium]|nr:tetratricopeptide repeat protein [Thermoanaerobaculia bacterium]